MKNIEWLKEEVNDYLDIEGVEDARMALKAVLGYIDQLDKPELPEIPDYVAEYIRREKENNFFSFTGVLGDIEYQYPKIQDWLYENQEEFFRAWFDDYTVEEKKYYIKIGPTRYARKYLEDRIDNQLAMFEKDAGVFTEKEILKLENGDKLWAFAKEVTK